MKSKIIIHKKNILRKIWVKFLNLFYIKRLYIDMDCDSNLQCLNWIVENANTEKIKNCNKSLYVNMNSQKDKTLYIVQNASTKNFKEILFNEGIDVRYINDFTIVLYSEKNNNFKPSLLVLEYDNYNKRIGTFICNANEPTIYNATSETVVRVILCIRIQGIGFGKIYGLRIYKPIKKININTNMQNYCNIDDDSVFIKLSLAKNKIEDVEKLKNEFSSQAYRWKKKALELQKIYENNNSIQIIPNAFKDFTYAVLCQIAGTIPKSNGVRFFNKIPLRVGIITDLYMFNYYKDVFQELLYITPTNYEKIASDIKMDILLYVTCWQGINNEEWRGIKFREKQSVAFNNIISRCRENNIKLVFQSIEDPSNFEYFLPIAKNFDYIFTSDIDMIPKYVEALGHNRVFYGEYGINPTLNNPIACRRFNLDTVFFAGSYSDRYKERCKDMEIIFDSILDSNGRLIIADRNYNTDVKELKYPERYNTFTIKPINHELLQSAHKLFRYNLNFNSIKNSPTMCAMRIYELQAQGKVLLSNYADSVFNKFPEIRIIPYKERLEMDLQNSDMWEEYHNNMVLVRNVFRDKTCFDIVHTMINNIGLYMDISSSQICVICLKITDSIKKMFLKQSFNNKILVEISKITDKNKWLNFKAKNNIKFLAWFEDDESYEKYYLEDMINCFKFTNSNYITKQAYFDKNGQFIDGLQHEFTTTMNGCEKSVFDADIFNPNQIYKYYEQGGTINIIDGYASDPFNLNYLQFKSLNKISTSNEFVLSVIVPVFNNGRFLISKCIPSLRRNKIWHQMEIILVDDGSTDLDTIDICDELVLLNDNIVLFKFEAGGSGSASRARNKGIELASAELISFLDPDNEISPEGYDILLDIFNEAVKIDSDIGFVSGYHVKVGESSKIVGKHTSERLSIIDDTLSAYFKNGKFPTVATQSAVISKRLFADSTFRFVEGAAGQDTLFGWELLCRSRKGVFTGDAYIIYYANRLGSVTNTIDAEYFQKKLILEKRQIEVLKKYNILEKYKESHFDNFFRNWYFEKLKLVSEDQKASCIAILIEIISLYDCDCNKYLYIKT